ncbi:MAG TPA: DUF342 domain-containing protein [Selenomonas sp.]|nr:DUF342 domain-containing protein [Selenomonadaceae bacterium]HCB92583.1 DUF342 domain-containing protein [Selenomonas sp.]
MEGEKSYPTVGGQDAGYLFEFKDDGVFLTVYEDETGDIKFELSNLRQIMRDVGVLDYDIELMARAVREMAGVPYRIAEPIELPSDFVYTVLEDGEEPPDELAFAKVMVEISRDRMKATVRYDTRAGSRIPTKEMVLEALNEKGVVYGIKEDAIDRGVESMASFVAAEGLPPVNGDDAYIDRKFDLSTKGKPFVDHYDRVDYKNLNLFVLTKKNDTLAIRIPQTKGTPGKNIFGDTVPAKNGKPIPMPEGKNTKVIGENRLIAEIDGQIVDTGKKISVDSKLVIKGAVGVATGNIDFDGSVEIAGGVQQGFMVKATGDIEIKGGVSGAEVEGRNVFIGGGITGMNRGRVRATQDVRAMFTENAQVEAGRDIYISDVVLHSTLRAGSRIIMEEKHGQITGGITVAGEEVNAKIIGNQAFVVTRVSVGVDPNLQRQYQLVCRNYKEGKKRLQQITQTLNTLGKIDISRLPQERIDQINALTRSQFPLAGQLKKDEKTIRELEAKLADMKQGRVRASDVIYPGTRLIVNSVMKNVYEEYRHCAFSLRDGEIALGPYE